MTDAERPNTTSTDRPVALALRDPASFDTTMAHLYRGEMQRMTVWRQRLDTTTHWGIVLTIGLTTFSLGTPVVPHYVMLLGLAFNALFMIIEGRRYQHLYYSKWRLTMMERNYFASLLDPSQPPAEPAWREHLARDLQRPHFTIGLVMGTRLRLRRNYLMLMYFVTVVWIAKLFIHPQSARGLGELHARLAVGGFLSSWFVLATAVVFVGGVTLLAALTPSEEAIERWSSLEHFRRTSARPTDCPPNG
jgi:uncharacterized membrane protein